MANFDSNYITKIVELAIARLTPTFSPGLTAT